MKVLGIESTCDETAASVVEDGKKLLSNVVHSQIDIHAAYGGVIPEVAARSHIEYINPVITKALSDAKLKWSDIDAIAVTNAPGLIGSLLVGNLAARTYAATKNIPIYPVHHVEAHMYANFITEKADGIKLDLPLRQPDFPILALIVSGGHSQLVLFRDHGNYELIGQTQDDAIGEAFDKVAKILGLPYPGGPSIAAAALLGDPDKYKLPRARMQNPYDFSFSGLKTAVLRAVQAEIGVDYTFPSHKLSERLYDETRNNFAASFQKTAVSTLVDATYKAFEEFKPASVVIAGGVAANLELRRQLREKIPIDIQYASPTLCTDNAAMVAALGYYHASALGSTSPYDLEVIPSLSMANTSWNK
jgi:N6-L-threonylcarbamoyladenine synthase